MLKETVLAYFGGPAKTAQALHLTKGAISQWKGRIPAKSALRVEYFTEGKLKVNPADYIN